MNNTDVPKEVREAVMRIAKRRTAAVSLLNDFIIMHEWISAHGDPGGESALVITQIAMLHRLLKFVTELTE